MAQSARTELASELERLMTVVEEVVGVLEASQTTSARGKALVEAGTEFREVLAAFPAGDNRKSMTDAIGELEDARHGVRLAMFALGLEEGMTISQLSRELGISRQLSARFAAEARGRAEGPTAEKTLSSRPRSPSA